MSAVDLRRITAPESYTLASSLGSPDWVCTHSATHSVCVATVFDAQHGTLGSGHEKPAR